MSSPDNLIGALQPVVSRVSTTTCWVKKDGKLTHLQSPLTTAKLNKHLNGGPYYGAAPISPGKSVTSIGLLDLDSHKGQTPWSDMQVLATKIIRISQSFNAHATPFRSSGGAGIHLYYVWDVPQDAYSVRQTLSEILKACKLKSGVKGVSQGEVEIFPKQDSVPLDGFGNMFILPLAAQSVPLDSFDLDDLPKESAIGMHWPISEPVPILVKPVAQIRTSDIPVELSQLQSALNAIPNTDTGLDYDEWRNVIFAIHHETQGSAEGLTLAHAFSAKSTKYDPEFLENRVWPFIKSERGSTITGRTILKMAHNAGWEEDIALKFDVIAPVKEDKLEIFPPFARKKNGEIIASIDNITMAVRSRDYTGTAIAFDEFRDEIMLAPKGTQEWRAFTDPDYTRMRIGLEKRGFGPVGREMIRDAVGLVAEENRFDSAITWLESLPKSKEKRCVDFLTRYCGVEDTSYHRAVSSYLWTALAGRVLTPGVQADMALILIGAQGLGKSTLAKSLAPMIDHFAEIALNDRDTDLSRKMRGTLIGEIGELRGLHSRELEEIKAFISRTHEEWTPKFKEFGTKFARRLIFIGTTNQEEILADETGNRRFLPVATDNKIDTAGIKKDLLLLWAEAREMYKQNGVMWKEAEHLAPEHHAKYMVSDAWAEDISQWLDGYDMDSTASRWSQNILIRDVLRGALNIAPGASTKHHEMRVAKVLKGLGFVKAAHKRVHGKVSRPWQYDLL